MHTRALNCFIVIVYELSRLRTEYDNLKMFITPTTIKTSNLKNANIVVLPAKPHN